MIEACEHKERGKRQERKRFKVCIVSKCLSRNRAACGVLGDMNVVVGVAL